MDPIVTSCWTCQIWTRNQTNYTVTWYGWTNETEFVPKCCGTNSETDTESDYCYMPFNGFWQEWHVLLH